MAPLWLVLLLAAGARAGELVAVDFVAGARTPASPSVGVWSPALNSLFNAPVPSSGWEKPLQTLKTLDWRDPRNAAAFDPFVAELAKLGLSPEQFAEAPAHQRAQAAQAAAKAVALTYGAAVDAAAIGAEAALSLGAQPALDAAVNLLKKESEAGLYLDDARKLKVEGLRRKALALQTEARAKKALERLRKDADALRSDDPIEAVLARDPSGEFSNKRPGQLLRFDPSKRKAPAAPKIELKPGQNSKAVLAGLMLGLSPQEAAKLGFKSEARDDMFSRYPNALSAAEAAAGTAGFDAEEVHFGEARMPVAGKSEGWTFEFYAIGDEGRSRARLIRVSVGARPAAQVVPAAGPVPEGIAALRIRSSSLGMGIKFSPFDALRFAGDAVAGVEVGLSISLRPVAEPVSNDTDLWYVISKAGTEVARVNARTGELRKPEPPKPPAEPGFWKGVRSWWASLFT